MCQFVRIFEDSETITSLIHQKTGVDVLKVLDEKQIPKENCES